MHTISFSLGGKPIRLTGPNSWDEVTPKQWLQWVRWQMDFGGNMASRFLLLQLWYGFTPKMLRRFDDEQKADALDLLDWSQSRPSRWMLPTFRSRFGRQYIGPGNCLENLTFGEFVFADAARNRYLESQKRADLVELTAVLYRASALFWEKTGDGGRVAFDRTRLDHQCRNLNSLPDAIHQATLVNYLGCIDALPAQFDHLFTPAVEGESNESSGSWLDVGLSLARQTAVFGTFHQLESTNLFLVLSTLNTMQKEAKDLEKLRKETQRK